VGPFAAPSRAAVPSGCYHQVWFPCWQWFLTHDNPLMQVASCLMCAVTDLAFVLFFSSLSGKPIMSHAKCDQ
jgi:hypothetical protein